MNILSLRGNAPIWVHSPLDSTLLFGYHRSVSANLAAYVCWSSSSVSLVGSVLVWCLASDKATVYDSIVGSVVECLPATQAARVWFPDDADHNLFGHWVTLCLGFLLHPRQMCSLFGTHLVGNSLYSRISGAHPRSTQSLFINWSVDPYPNDLANLFILLTMAEKGSCWALFVQIWNRDLTTWRSTGTLCFQWVDIPNF